MSEEKEIRKLAKKLFKVARKHGKNLNVSVESHESGISEYKIEITGEWTIMDNSNAVEIYKVPSEIECEGIKGTRKR